MKNQLHLGLIVFLLAGCVSVQEVRRATDLIRTDNELTRLLVEARPEDQTNAAAYLIGLAVDAGREADALAAAPNNRTEAIAYYRIASTAYWKSGGSEGVDALFQAAEKGAALCAGLGKEAPDRDCLFLRLVIPFAGLESVAREDLGGMLEEVNFNDGSATETEKAMMREIHKWLQLAKAPTQTILAVGTDDRLLSHGSMRDYYCRNAKAARDYYDPTVSVFITKVREYGNTFGDPRPALNVTLEEARALKLSEGVPAFCPQ
ncbi:MAG: hypothetical protein JXB25_00320 [Deltaproteobacteria bacterium]|nr:hypothetical protein [Deltaproteobacteria bacterium]